MGREWPLPLRFNGPLQGNLGGAAADANALYLVCGGTNDLRDITQATFASTITSTISHLTGIVGSLYQLGARNFLLPNRPDIGLTPEARSDGPVVQGGAAFASETFNTGLASAYGALGNALFGERFTYFNVMSAQRALTAGAPGNGFSHVSQGCFTGYVGIAGTQCADPSGYLYRDKIHPISARTCTRAAASPAFRALRFPMAAHHRRATTTPAARQGW